MDKNAAMILNKANMCIAKVCRKEEDMKFIQGVFMKVLMKVSMNKDVVVAFNTIKDFKKIKDPYVEILPLLTTIIMNKNVRKALGNAILELATYMEKKTDAEITEMFTCAVKNCGLTLTQIRCMVELGAALYDFMRDPVITGPSKKLAQIQTKLSKRTLKLIKDMEKKEQNGSK